MFRVVEFGSGTGGLTKDALPLLDAGLNAELLQYTATDITNAFSSGLLEAVKSPKLQFKVWRGPGRVDNVHCCQLTHERNCAAGAASHLWDWLNLTAAVLLLSVVIQDWHWLHSIAGACKGRLAQAWDINAPPPAELGEPYNIAVGTNVLHTGTNLAGASLSNCEAWEEAHTGLGSGRSI